MKTLGICFGATTLQAVGLTVDPQVRGVERVWRIAHEGNPSQALLDFLGGIDVLDYERIAVTGRHFRHSVKLTSIAEPEAVEAALAEEYAGSQPDIVVSLGGETQIVYSVGRTGEIVSVHSGNKCASGTGEFFLQQVRRMGLALEEAVQIGQGAAPHRIAGRCSVFCKSDCTHALNKGESKAAIVSGLCSMMAGKIAELINDLPSDKVAVIGGGSQNHALVEFLRRRFPGLVAPAQAAAFEAYGAALWAATHPCRDLPSAIEDVIDDRPHSFGTHPALGSALGLVEFRSCIRGSAHDGDECILGLDVGSTTTKAALVRRTDRALVASVYLRTNGDPVAASRACYAEIARQLTGTSVTIAGLAVTGSGRHIAALHAQSDNVINEIIAHATAAAHFDPTVDTVFEIGGQDAKYTYLTGGVASDYAMNEACSAGTGSFLEEAARESLNVVTEEIGELALRGNAPPNFTDQCAAFISSDVKRAAQEGIGCDDILAGLVYSICQNYLNRVKGSRPVGKKVFMQGGVCYNKAVPVAMAALMQSPIIVPPEPGLMGAFGVALELDKRIQSGLAVTSMFDLTELAGRTAVRASSFVCAGGREKCDRKCEISRIRVGEKLLPFGGACSRYYSSGKSSEVDVEALDLVAVRQRLLFDKYCADAASGRRHDRTAARRPSGSSVGSSGDQRTTVGIPRTFLTQTLFPLYATFFTELGMRVVLSDEIDAEGMRRTDAPYCLPAELAHGSFANLLKKKLDYIFVPHVMQVPVANVPTYSRMCIFVQGEPYFLRSTFREEIESSPTVVLSPVLKMQGSYARGSRDMVAMARGMGITEKRATGAFDAAAREQRWFEKELRRLGTEALARLDASPDTFGVVLFGRPYSAFASEANMGIPHKIASRGYMVIPHDMLPFDALAVDKKMFWAAGQKIMKGAQFVKQRANLFGVYITNFSCGPDSFLLGFFRNLMGIKPSLTLELDQHTADAGIDTRIEAAVDVIKAYRRSVAGLPVSVDLTYKPARVLFGDVPQVISSDGKGRYLTDSKVEFLLPSMGKYATQAMAAVLRGSGINAVALPVPDKDTLLIGRKNTSGKECVPYILTTGSFLQYLERKTDPDKVSLLFLPTGGGPCRLGQYSRALEQLVHNHKMRNVAVLTLSDENGYAGLGSMLLLRGWQSIVASDVFGDIRSTLRATAVDPDQAVLDLEAGWREIMAFFEGRLSVRFTTVLSNVVHRLSRIPLRRSPHDVPTISLVGEIFVRREEFARKNLVDYLEDQGFRVRVAPVSEFLCYGNYVIHSGLGERQFTIGEQVKMKVTASAQEFWEWRIKSICAQSGLYDFEMNDVARTISGVKHLMNENFRGECILTIGLAMREILAESCGVISLGPFGCMPSRVAEAILKREMSVTGKARMPGSARALKPFVGVGDLPFLALETDGSPFPQLVEACLEAFVIRARRLHDRMMRAGRRRRRTNVSRTVVALHNED